MKKIILLAVLLLSFMGFSQIKRQVIQSHFAKNTEKLGLTKEDVSDWIIEGEALGQGTKVTSQYIVQRYKGIEIFNAQSNVTIKDGKIINASNKFISNISQKGKLSRPKLSVIDAMKAVLFELGITSNNNFAIVDNIDNKRFIGHKNS